jgi:hypothetical protein
MCVVIATDLCDAFVKATAITHVGSPYFNLDLDFLLQEMPNARCTLSAHIGLLSNDMRSKLRGTRWGSNQNPYVEWVE